MKWENSFSTGCNLIDSQHKKLVEYVDRLENEIAEKVTLSKIGETLQFTVDYIKSHFKDEEALMERIQFPFLFDQIAMHQELIDFITCILLDLRAGNPCNFDELNEFLQNWVRNHVLKEDKKIGDFIRKIEYKGEFC